MKQQLKNIPDGWSTAYLPEVLSLHDNERKPINRKERDSRLENSTQRFPYYGATGQVGYIDEYLSNERSILLGEDGAPFLNLYKKKAYIVEGQFWVNNHAHIVRAKGGQPNSFYCHQLNQFNFKGFVSGTTRLKLTQASMKKMRFLVPPLAEQERIVDKIDELFSAIEAGERAIEQARIGVARYRKAILKAAVTGELTKDWRDENSAKESAEDLLASILTARYEAWEKAELEKLDAKGKARPETEKQWEKFKRKHKPPVEAINSSSNLPSGWINVTVDQVSEFITSGSRGWAKYYSNEGAVFVRVGNLNRSSVDVDFTKLQHVSPPDGAEGARTRLMLNDILVSITADVGMVGVFRGQYEEAYINQHVSLVRVPSETNQDWIAWAIVSPTKQQEILGTGRGATKDGLTLTDLRELVVPFPPAEEQAEIVDRVEKSLSKADAVEATLDAQSRAAKALKQAVLKTAFEGKLVPQNPNDEPASELLKRIKEET